MSQNTQLDELYEKAVIALDLDGAGLSYDTQQENKNFRGKLRRIIRKAYKIGEREGSASSEPFVWLDHRGHKHLPQQMATPHLFYAIRMIWNHSVPEYYRIPGVRRYADVPHWSREYRKEALVVLADELAARPDSDLTDDQHREISYMTLASETIAARGGI